MTPRELLRECARRAGRAAASGVRRRAPRDMPACDAGTLQAGPVAPSAAAAGGAMAVAPLIPDALTMWTPCVQERRRLPRA